MIMEGNYRRALDGATDDPFVRAFGADVPAIAAQACELSDRVDPWG